MYAASSLARNKYAGATSIGCPALFIGESDPNVDTLFALKLDTINGVHIGPGATAFTLIPLSTRLAERLLVKDTIAPFVEA
jgi:hypothetical protein